MARAHVVALDRLLFPGAAFRTEGPRRHSGSHRTQCAFLWGAVGHVGVIFLTIGAARRPNQLKPLRRQYSDCEPCN
jgi:hypothetical protein